ncbi:MAG TPA: ABC transporter permease [Gemmatimonadales bacterium]|jgi:ABC-2 type transport system permease protein
MNKILAVIRRELNARVRTKAFIISTLLLPVMMVAVTVLPALLSSGTARTMRLAIVDASTDSLGARVEQALARQKLNGDTATNASQYALARVTASPADLSHVRDSLVAKTGLGGAQHSESFDGVLVIDSATLRTGKLEYLGSNTSAMESMGQLEGTVSQVLIATRLQHAGIDPKVMATSLAPADLTTIKVTDGKATGQSGTASFFIAYIMGFVLYLTMTIYGQQTLTSVIEEKTSRIMEVLVSSLSPFQMLLGKILGVGLTGLLQIGIWAGTIVVLTTQRANIAALFHVSADAMQSFAIPTMSPALLVIFMVFFVLGFLLYGSLYAAVGSMFNVVQEAQQMAFFVQMVMMVAFISMFAILKDPNGGLGVAMSIIPFFSPLIMPVRWSLATVPPVQLVLSLGLAVFALVAVAWIAGRIYRTGILMYGKKPSLREVFRWVGPR